MGAAKVNGNTDETVRCRAKGGEAEIVNAGKDGYKSNGAEGCESERARMPMLIDTQGYAKAKS